MQFIDYLTKMIKIKEIGYGLACKIGKVIYLNKKLREYPKLRKVLLKHEQEHTDSFELKDVMLDLKGGYLRGVKLEYYKFILENPKTWVHFLPIWKYGKIIAIDPIMSFVWLMGIFFLFILKIIIFVL